MHKKVVFGAAFHWRSHLHIGSHQYAKQFARTGYKVAYISEPISPFHYFFARDRSVLKEKHRSWFSGGNWVEKEKIWAYVPFTLLPGYVKPFYQSRWIMDNSHHFTIPQINQMCKKNDFEHADLVFLDEAFGYLLDIISYEKCVLRIHDDLSYLFNKGFKNFLRLEKDVMKKVDLVIIVNPLLEAVVKEMGANRVIYIPNGADFDHFFYGSNIMPPEYSNVPAPRVIYVGSINYWLDLDLIAYSAKKLSHVSFILIGNPMIDIKNILSLPNVFVLGKRNHEILPQYIKNANVGIIPWRADLSRTIFSHPIQFYEYMACGIPVISTKWPELESFESPAYLASTYEEFVRYIEDSIEENDQVRTRNIEFARNNSWENRFGRLIKALYPN